MSAQIIALADERKRREALRQVHELMWRWLPPGGGPSNSGFADAVAVRQLQSIVTPELRKLADESSRLARALARIIGILDAKFVVPRARIDALWNESDIDAPWFRAALRLPEGLTFTSEPDADAGA